MSGDAPAGDHDRPRGLLSSADREYLADPEEYVETRTRQSAKERRDFTEERVRNGLLDFSLLLAHLDKDGAEDLLSMGEGEESERILDGLRDTLAFIYYATHDRPEPFDFETLLETAVNRANEREHDIQPPAVDVTLEVEDVPVSTYPEIYGRLRQGGYGDLSDGELRLIVRTLLDAGVPVAELFDESMQEIMAAGEDGGAPEQR